MVTRRGWLLLLLLSSALWADDRAPASFTVMPLVCMGPEGEPCRLEVHLGWRQHERACLVLRSRPSEPLLCAREVEDHPLNLVISGNVTLQLLSTDGARLLAERELRHLQPAELPASLIRRRLEWSIFR
ncbi:DUF3019 domain-containing protein [Gallaecimonas sp. GXIMD4217]|uniref:DUF3019 domain-containing protein n=1 Tax=Gallaecimonas sp. GXIMD4217 TaxID=3131927 RepID=UPI00311B3FFF